MKLYSLGETCTVLEWRGIRLMLDCGLHLPAMQRFLPVDAEPHGVGKAKHSDGKPSKRPRPDTEEPGSGEMPFTRIGGNVFIEAGAIRFRVPEWGLLDLAAVDAILISNAQNMLALPFITEHSAFRGRVYATEPTVQIASMMMQELVKYAEKVQYPEGELAPWQNEDLIAALPPELQVQLADAMCWRTLYGRRDVEEAISKVHRVSFHQHINLLGVMEAVPVSSGFALGSANWILRTDNEKVIYVADSSLSPGRHPQPLDNTLFSNCDMMIMTSLSPEPQYPPEAMVQELCNLVGSTLSSGGQVLLPSFPGGIIFDLIEVLHSYLQTAGHPRVPLYFISPVADQALAYSNICAEWLCKPKQDKSYLPEWPFIHADLQQSGRLQHYTGVDDPGFAAGFKEPCVVFCGHPSLRCGEVIHFINTWGHEARNAIIFTEPGFDYAAGLSPFHGLKCRTAYCPIDPRLTFVEANAVIRAHMPSTVVVPAAYTTGKGGPITEANSIIAMTRQTITYRPLDVIALPSHRKQTQAALSAELAMSLKLQKRESYGGGLADNVVAMAPLSAVLSSKDHKLDLKSLPATDAPAADRSRRVLLGVPAIDAIIQALAERGIRDVHVENKPQKRAMVLTVDSLSASVLLSPTKTKITTTDEQARQLLLDIITSRTLSLS